MVIFHSYVSLPEGMFHKHHCCYNKGLQHELHQGLRDVVHGCLYGDVHHLSIPLLHIRESKPGLYRWLLD